jgi:hypothetical protein
LVIGAGNGKKYRESVDLHISREREREGERGHIPDEKK